MRFKLLLPAVFLFLMICSATALGQTAKPFTIKGKLSASATGYVYLRYTDNKGVAHKDSSLISNGIFNFKGTVSSPFAGFLAYQNTDNYVIIEPGNILLTSKAADLADLVKAGTATQLEDQELRNSVYKIQKRWKVVMDTLNAVNKRSNVQFQEFKGWVLEPYFEEQKELEQAFYDKHPSSYVTAFYMRVSGRDMSDQELKSRYRRFSPQVKASIFGKDVAKQIEDRKFGAIGTIATNFNHADINGKPLELTSLRGKYVLLDFWGSWCVPCRKGNPHLLDVYAEYKSKGLEIVGIAADDREPDAWRKAVAEDKLVWPQILQGNKPNDDLGKAYNIMYYPTKILIDKQGKIIGRFGEEPEELDKMLKGLM